tara:strand:- start:1575 stop:1880 length:306 start_codon:yes stop_codon:yes gene_type:complete
MIELLQFKISTRKGKKYMMVLNVDGRGKTIHFGSAVSQTYIDHLDDIKKENYIARHEVNEDFTKINPASASRYILWNKKTLKKSLKSFMKRFNIKDSRKEY